MLFAIIGDTHGQQNQLIINHLQELEPDVLCFTGDKYPDGKKMAQTLKIPLWGVIGNCDWFISEPEEILKKWENINIFITHGHQYGVKNDLNRLFFRAQELKAQVVMFGHTHIPFLATHNRIIFINPGSPTKPRAGSVASFGVLEIIDDMLEVRLLHMVTGETIKYIKCYLHELTIEQ